MASLSRTEVSTKLLVQSTAVESVTGVAGVRFVPVIVVLPRCTDTPAAKSATYQDTNVELAAGAVAPGVIVSRGEPPPVLRSHEIM